MNRYSSAGLAHSAADRLTEETGLPYRMVFKPRRYLDKAPFTVELVA